MRLGYPIATDAQALILLAAPREPLPLRWLPRRGDDGDGYRPGGVGEVPARASALGP